jgi:hypothetical protein
LPSRSGKPAAVIGKRGKEKKLQAGQYEMMDRFVLLVASLWFYLAVYSSASKMHPAVPSRKSVTLPTLHSLTFQQAAINLCLCGSPCIYLISQTSLFFTCNKYISEH